MVYTLANAPASLTLTADSQTQITASWSANGNANGTENYAENITASTTSGYVSTTSWASTGLTCGTSYSFRVKARNGDAIETAFSSTSTVTTANCSTAGTTGGGGLPPNAYSRPMSWSDSLLINNGAAYTNSPYVTLSFKS